MKKKVDSLHANAVRLVEGGVVEIGGQFVKAIDVGHEENPCNLCSMDCVCCMELADLCAECDGITHTKHILKFAYEQN